MGDEGEVIRQAILAPRGPAQPADLAPEPVAPQPAVTTEGGALPPSLLPAFAPLREATEAQFDVARQNIIGRTGARGGQLREALRDLEVNRAQAIGGLEAPLRQGLFNQALGVSFGQIPAIQAGLGAAGSSLAQIAGAQMQQQAASGEATGQLEGIALKAALKGAGAPPGLPAVSTVFAPQATAAVGPIPGGAAFT